MRHVRLVVLWLLLAGLSSGVAYADIIYLKNGNEVEGTIEEETPLIIMIRLRHSGLLHSVKKSEVDLIIRAKQLAERAPAQPPGVEPVKGTVKEAPDKTAPAAKTTGEEGKKGEAEKTGEATKTDEKKTEQVEQEEEDKVPPDVLKAVAEAITKLDSNDPAVRSEGRLALQAVGQKGVPAMVEGLYHPRPSARTAVAEVLGQLGGKTVVKQLIEALYAALPGEGGAVPYQRGYADALANALAGASGERFIANESRNPVVQEGLQRYIEWYSKNWDKLPPQAGEPKIDAKATDALKKLEEARRLRLVKRVWPVPPGPADIATGVSPESPQAKREQEETKRMVPTVDRKTGGGVFREADKRAAKDTFSRP